jgi:gamma-glutamylcyclotransferase (GGCT)/AIG2-like uncharacterized protein YtfP
MFYLFTYGSLRPGGQHHHEFCRGFLPLEKAAVPGTMGVAEHGYPLLRVRCSMVLEHGSANAQADFALEKKWRAEPTLHWETGGMTLIAGDLMSFPDVEVRLPRLDAFEEFSPGRKSDYLRVLLPVKKNDGTLCPAWCYVAPF